MKHFKLLIVASLLLGISDVKAQKITSFEDTQARTVDTYARAYVRPLTCELEVIGRVSDSLPYTMQEVEAMSYGNNINLDNLRSRALFDLAAKENVDAIVAATFHIKGSNTTGFVVKIKGFKANFTKWSTATDKDYVWIFREGAVTTTDAQSGAAAAAIRTNATR